MTNFTDLFWVLLDRAVSVLKNYIWETCSNCEQSTHLSVHFLPPVSFGLVKSDVVYFGLIWMNVFWFDLFSVVRVWCSLFKPDVLYFFTWVWFALFWCLEEANISCYISWAQTSGLDVPTEWSWEFVSHILSDKVHQLQDVWNAFINRYFCHMPRR